MNTNSRILLYYLISFLFLLANSHAQELYKDVEPYWILDRNINLNVDNNVLENSGSVHIFLNDQQTLYSDHEVYNFFNQVFQLRTLQAIEQIGTLQIVFNPAYQKYNIHKINVIRGDETIDVTPDIRITIDSFNAEASTEDHEGQNVVQLYISDLRRNDIIDFSYTITGQNPAFENRTIGFSTASATADLYNVYRKFTVPKNRKINFKYLANHKEPTVTSSDTSNTYEWYWDKIEQSIFEDNVPTWYSEFPLAVYSDFQNWNEVAVWATDLFSFENNEDDFVNSNAQNIIKDAKNDFEKLIAIQSFMQTEIRYTGLEIGRNGFRPFPPNDVIRRRYGDCKDQAVLLIALLNAVGIQSKAAFVNSIDGKLVELYPESPQAFNHVIVQTRIDGDEFWLDPTISLPQDKKADLIPPRYINALILDNETTELSTIPLQEKFPASPHIYSFDEFMIKAGISDDMTWKRKTQFLGSIANLLRSSVDYIGERQLGINLRTAHQKKYENIKNIEFTKAFDDGEKYVIQEHYNIPKAGKYEEVLNVTRFIYAPDTITELLINPTSISDRKAPFAISFPARRRATVSFDVLGANFQEFNKRVQNQYFTYQFAGYYEKDKFVVHYNYETHQDHVPIAGLQRYKEDIELILGEIPIIIGSVGTNSPRIEVYQAVLNQKKEMVDINNMDVDKKIETFVNTNGLEYLTESREEILEIINDKSLSVNKADEFFATIISYATSANMLNEAYYYHDLHVKSKGKLSSRIILFLARSLYLNDDVEKAINVLQKELDDYSGSPNGQWPEIVHNFLREIYWFEKDFKNLIITLETLTTNFAKKEEHYRELKFLYSKFGLDGKKNKIEKLMNELGFSDIVITPIDENSEYQRNPRLLFTSEPIYPQNAARYGIEGFANVEFSILETGEVRNCRIIDSSPSGIFDSTACQTVTNSYYYPIEESEAPGEIKKFKKKIEFKISN